MVPNSKKLLEEMDDEEWEKDILSTNIHDQYATRSGHLSDMCLPIFAVTYGNLKIPACDAHEPAPDSEDKADNSACKEHQVPLQRGRKQNDVIHLKNSLGQ